MYYESVFILSGQLTEKAANEKFTEIKSIIEKSGAKILKNEYWGLRELAYKINALAPKAFLSSSGRFQRSYIACDMRSADT